MELEIDITEICHGTEGECMLSEENWQKHGHCFCFGENFGTELCPLKNKKTIIEIKTNRAKDVKEALKGE